MRCFLLTLPLLAFGASACSSPAFDVGAGDGGLTDAMVDSTFVDTGPDAPAKNACGGTAELPSAPGGACGACGKFVCDSSKESVHCEDADKNVCGGCGTITEKLGDNCGACGRYLCKPDGTGVTCNDPGKNECGGCTKLPGKVGEPCGGGTCGVGTLACAGKDTFSCSGALGTNACGGCGVLAGTPGAACGGCGVYTCAADKTSVNCLEASPSPGTACGLCKSSTYTCSALATTTCKKPDDSVSLADLAQDKIGGPVTPSIDHAHMVAIAYTARHAGRIQWIKVNVAKAGYVCPPGGATLPDAGFSDASLADSGLPIDAVSVDASAEPLCSSADPSCTCAEDKSGGCACSGSTDGALYVYLYKGTPTGASTLLATASIPSGLITSTASYQTFVFPSSIPTVAKGDSIWFAFYTPGNIHAFALQGIEPGPSTTNPDVVFWTRDIYPAGGFVKHPTSAVPATIVQMLGCF
ncbi:MAG: hypothetical protein JNL79_12040 [Myxococcales bacterium]|nr:hypothetical protein [Myxococcales bacterium]